MFAIESGPTTKPHVLMYEVWVFPALSYEVLHVAFSEFISTSVSLPVPNTTFTFSFL